MRKSLLNWRWNEFTRILMCVNELWCIVHNIICTDLWTLSMEEKESENTKTPRTLNRLEKPVRAWGSRLQHCKAYTDADTQAAKSYKCNRCCAGVYSSYQCCIHYRDSKTNQNNTISQDTRFGGQRVDFDVEYHSKPVMKCRKSNFYGLFHQKRKKKQVFDPHLRLRLRLFSSYANQIRIQHNFFWYTLNKKINELEHDDF